MITNLRLIDFKNFADESLTVGPFTVIVGANASGKSNIRDACRFLHGVGRGYSLAEVIGGRYGDGGQQEWGGIRGSANEIVRFGAHRMGMNVDLQIPVLLGLPAVDLRYQLDVGQSDLGFTALTERLSREGRAEPIFTSNPRPSDLLRNQSEALHSSVRLDGRRIPVRRTQPALTQVFEPARVSSPGMLEILNVTSALRTMRFLEPSLDRLREPAFPGQIVLGDGGDNLPTVLRKLCDDAHRKDALLEWTRELTPMDVADFEFPVDPTTGRVQLAIKENDGTAVSAYAASDGTLRFLAMLATLLDDETKGLYFFEEIDNGIHPSRVRLLVELIESRTAEHDIQVVTTTHSPDLLGMVGDETFANTSVVCRRPDRSDAVIRRIADLPNADELRHSQGLGRLHTSGWLEDAVYFEDAEE